MPYCYHRHGIVFCTSNFIIFLINIKKIVDSMLQPLSLVSCHLISHRMKHERWDGGAETIILDATSLKSVISCKESVCYMYCYTYKQWYSNTGHFK